MRQPVAISSMSAPDVAGPQDYFDLLKPRVMSLVVFTAAVGMVAAVADGARVPFGLALASLFAIAVGAGASGALNMWWDADIDSVMARTVGRPVPRGVVPRAEAAAFGGFLSALSVALLALSSNYVAAALLAFTIFFYLVIYSMWLKRSTPQNIVIGGAAGALPPVVAWAAVTGTAPVEAWILFAIIFLWTPPHFWALALYRDGDYARAGVPMMPNVAGRAATKRQIFAYSVVLAVAGLAPYFVGMAGPFYLAVAAALGGVFVYLAFKTLRSGDEDKASAKQLFAFSIIHLFAIFAAVLIEDLVALHV
ncbi:MAG: protoheme IX farnesyltransferase [Parvularculaceae bacterium]|nr:protoheme IX farnesyltransferase [Parvularculaceae bacterium]